MYLSLKIPRAQKDLYLIALGVFIAQVAFSAVTPFLPSYLLQLGLKSHVSLWSGMVFSINYLTFGIMAPIWGSVSDRSGKKLMMLRAGIGMTITYSLMAFAKNPLQLLLIRGLNGMISGYTPAAISLVATNSSSENLNYNLGVVQASSATGSILGPLVGGFLARVFGMKQSIIITSLLIFFAAILPFLAKVEEKTSSQEKTTVREDIKHAFGNPQLVKLFFAWLFIQAAIMAINPTLPLFIANINQKDSEFYTGLVFSITGISTALGAPIVSRLHKISTKKLFNISLLICSILTAVQGFTTTIISLTILRFFFGFFHSAVTVAGNVLIATNSDDDSKGSSFGVLNGIMSIGLVLGPVLGGFLGDKLGLAHSFFGSGALFFIAFVISLKVKEIYKSPAKA